MNPAEIRALRNALDLTQAQFAQLLGVHHLTVWKWEQGRSRPTPHHIAMMQSFRKAQRNDPDIGAAVLGVLLGAGVAAAIFLLLKTAFEKVR